MDVGELAVSSQYDDVLVAYALGSCIGVAVHDSRARVAGLAHIQLPNSKAPHAASRGVYAFADVALPELFHRCYALGATKQNLRVIVAGGSNILDPGNHFQIGRKNYLMVKKLLWQNGVFVTTERVGGLEWRTVSVCVGTGEVTIKMPESVEVC